MIQILKGLSFLVFFSSCSSTIEQSHRLVSSERNLTSIRTSLLTLERSFTLVANVVSLPKEKYNGVEIFTNKANESVHIFIEKQKGVTCTLSRMNGHHESIELKKDHEFLVDGLNDRLVCTFEMQESNQELMLETDIFVKYELSAREVTYDEATKGLYSTIKDLKEDFDKKATQKSFER